MSDNVYELVESGPFHQFYVHVPMEEAANIFYTKEELVAKFAPDELDWNGKSKASAAPEYMMFGGPKEHHYIMINKLVQYVLDQLADPKKKSVTVEVPVPHIVSFSYNKMFREQYGIQFSPSKMEFTRAPKQKAKPLTASKAVIMSIQREMISSLETLIRRKYGLVNVKIAATSSKNQLNNGVLLAKDLGYTVDTIICKSVESGTIKVPGYDYEQSTYTWTRFTLAEYLASTFVGDQVTASPEMQVLLHKVVSDWWDNCTKMLK